MRLLIWLVTPVVAVAGCSPVAYTTHNASLPTIRAAKVLEPGEMGIQAGLAGSDVEREASAYVNARRGITETVELQGQVSGTISEPQKPTLRGPNGEKNPRILTGALRLGMQWEAVEWCALYAGAGGGGSLLGGFVSTDGGVIFSYTNRYVIPVVSFGGYAAIPATKRSITVVDDVGPTELRTTTQQLTAGVDTTVGIRVPVELARVRLEIPAGLRVLTKKRTHELVGDQWMVVSGPAFFLSAGVEVIF